MGGEATAWLIAVTGFITGVGALYLNRRSQTEQNMLQQAANKVAADKHRLEETQQALDAMEALLDRATADADKYRARAGDLETDLDEAKMLHRSLYAAQEARCREYAQELTEAILILRQVVTEEIAAAAADRALTRDGHPHEDSRDATAARWKAGEEDVD